MCRAVDCRTCGRTTWAGCGSHVDQVMAGVPRKDRCRCTPDDHAAAKASRGSLLTRLRRG